ncbi:peptidase S8/S53 domain-containing protein [Biscogniauxia mediterranea]|nr:peptidase S8/S53 domain-containing protein [Biscogniauxia mediterranea]
MATTWILHSTFLIASKFFIFFIFFIFVKKLVPKMAPRCWTNPFHLLLLALCCCCCCVVVAGAAALAPPAEQLRDGDAIPGRFVVSLKPGVEADDHIAWVQDIHRRNSDLARRTTAGLGPTYAIGRFRGYAGEFDDETVEMIRGSGNVLSVEPDRVAHITALTTQNNAPWGLASLSSRDPLANGSIRGHAYTYDDSAGEGTFAYVLDTGVMIENSELQGRAIRGYNAWPNEPFEDSFGHGSHVAGIIASASYGVAKKATIVDVKVARSVGYATLATILDGYNYAVNNMTNIPGRAAKSVINMSLAIPVAESLNSAIDAAFELGVLTVVGAGNDGADASTRSPASAASAVTVGAVDWTRARPQWSNYGPGVDVFAPGVDVASLWNEEGAESVNSGTSMSTPHVAGLALYLKALGSDADAPADAVARIKDLALKGVVTGEGQGSPNLLVWNGVA